MTQSPRILIVDDDEGVRDLLTDIFADRYSCTTADSGPQALRLLRTSQPDLVLSDINMPGMSGLEIIPMVFEAAPDAVVMIITGGRTIDDAIAAMRAGAFDFIQKPFDIAQVELAVKRALEHHALLIERKEHAAGLERLVADRTRRLEYLAYHDDVTGLPNRAFFNQRLGDILRISDPSPHKTAVILLAPDRFRNIRDAIGYEASNQLLKQLGERLIAVLPSRALVSRLDGSEFGLVLANMSDSLDVTAAVDRILDAVKVPFLVDHHRISINASMGISLHPDDGVEEPSLVKNAGVALALAARLPASTYEFFSGDMHAAALRRLRLDHDLRTAVDGGELEVHYQPKIEMATGRVLGMEALLRWRHPALGQISPSEFIPIGEDTGSIVDIGDWVLREACAQTAAWRLAGHDISIAINLSPLQFAVGLSDKVHSVLADTGLDATALNLEVTESSLIRDPEISRSVLHNVKRLGAQISIDDFGTGYSSLAHLKSLPIDVLKIDKSFVSDVNTDPGSAALVVAITNLARDLGLKVVAEGVENDAQLEFLSSLRCDEWQGFLFSRAVPADDVAPLLVRAHAVGRTLSA